MTLTQSDNIPVIKHVQYFIIYCLENNDFILCTCFLLHYVHIFSEYVLKVLFRELPQMPGKNGMT